MYITKKSSDKIPPLFCSVLYRKGFGAYNTPFTIVQLYWAIGVPKNRVGHLSPLFLGKVHYER